MSPVKADDDLPLLHDAPEHATATATRPTVGELNETMRLWDSVVRGRWSKRLAA